MVLKSVVENTWFSAIAIAYKDPDILLLVGYGE